MKRATLITLYILLVLAAILFVQPCVWGQVPLKQSTAVTVALQQPFVDATDGFTREKALTVTGWACTLVKGATASTLTITASGGNNDAAHLAQGLYSLELTAGNTDTVGPLFVDVNDPNARAVTSEFFVYPANVYDSLYAGSDKLLVDVNEWRSGAIPAVNTTGVPLVDANLVSNDTLGAIAVTSGNVHVHLKAADDNVIVDVNATDVQTAMTSQGYTAARGPYLDILNDLGGISQLGDKIQADMDANSVLANATYGLSAIQTLVTDANNNTEALLGDPNEASLAADLADILAQMLLLVGDANDTDIAGAFDAIGYTAARAVKLDTITDVNDTLDNATYGLPAMKTLIDGLGTTTTSIRTGQWSGRKN